MTSAGVDRAACDRAVCWAVQKALPLWATAGFDAKTGLFHERLTFQATPINPLARRLMVQARQIATYSRAMSVGLYKPDFSIEACIEIMVRLYRSADDASGWVFSIGPDLRPADRTRDLYAHAFTLYALAWTYKLTQAPHILEVADDLLDMLDRQFLLADGSFADAIPARDSLRRQNPHMHLLEAFLAMAEACGSDRYLERAHALVCFAQRYFLEPHTGMLLEEFDTSWSPLKAVGLNRVEPGHLFEWGWLLREYERLSGDDCSADIDRFLSYATQYGNDPASGLIYDVISETGEVVEGNFRCWPHTEAVKACLAEAAQGKTEYAAAASAYLDRLFTIFAPPSLNGGWVDRVNRQKSPLVDYMPASTLYHAMGAIYELNALSL